MALSRVKTWSTEDLTPADINAEFDNIINNEFTIGWPADRARSLNGFALILDNGGNSNLRAGTDNIAVLTLNSFAAMTFTGTGTPVNGADWSFGATTVDCKLTAQGETNTGIDLIPKGTGGIKTDGFRTFGATDENNLAQSRMFSGL